MKKDLNYIAKLEQAIAKKYGDEAIRNFRSDWDDKKEKEYLEQLKKLAKKDQKQRDKEELVEKEGFFVSKKLLTKENKRICFVCSNYSFDRRDSLYMAKFECCHRCYIVWIEDREERWLGGWRPKHMRRETNVD